MIWVSFSVERYLNSFSVVLWSRSASILSRNKRDGSGRIFRAMKIFVNARVPLEAVFLKGKAFFSTTMQRFSFLVRGSLTAARLRDYPLICLRKLERLSSWCSWTIQVSGSMPSTAGPLQRSGVMWSMRWMKLEMYCTGE